MTLQWFLQRCLSDVGRESVEQRKINEQDTQGKQVSHEQTNNNVLSRDKGIQGVNKSTLLLNL